MKKTKLILILTLLYVTICEAQQDSQFTQYVYNTASINPAYVGSRGVFSTNSLYRTQWVGLEGAPRTLTASFNTPVGYRGVGLGLSFIQDDIGPSKESNIVADFSYTIRTSEVTKLAFGLKAGFNLLDVNFSDLTFNPSEPNAQNIRGRFTPAIGIGFYLYHSKWYAGLSSPNFLRTKHYNDAIESTATEEATIYAIGGYVFDLSSAVKFKPAILTKGVVGAPLAVDLSANFLFHDKLTLGVSYRLDAAVSAIAGFQISDGLLIGYAYDYDTTSLGSFNSGSHEIFLRFEIINPIKNKVNPRFF